MTIWLEERTAKRKAAAKPGAPGTAARAAR